MTIHQPSSAVFSTFDDLYLLQRGGLLAFSGTVEVARKYFATVGFPCPEDENPADFFLELTSKTPLEARSEQQHAPANALAISEDTTWSDLFKHSSYRYEVPEPNLAAEPSDTHIIPSEFERLRILVGRGLVFNMRNSVYRFRTLQLLFVALYLGTLYLRLGKVGCQAQGMGMGMGCSFCSPLPSPSICRHHLTSHNSAAPLSSTSGKSTLLNIFFLSL